MLIVSGFLIVALAVVAAVFVAAVDPSATAIVASARLTEPSATLVVRFIDRSRRFRRAGVIAALLTFVAGLVVWQAEAKGAEGFTLDLVTLIGIGLTGSTLGSIAAEAFRLRRPRGPRVASLDVREPDAYRDRVAGRLELVVVVATALVVGGAAVSDASIAVALWWAAALVTLAGLRWWATRAITLRPRPVMAVPVQEADDLVRRLAVSAGLGRPIGTLQALVASAACGAVVRGTRGVPGNLVGAVGAASQVLGVIFFLLAIGWWVHNRGFGLRPAPLRPNKRTFVVLAAVLLPLVAMVVVLVVARTA